MGIIFILYPHLHPQFLSGDADPGPGPENFTLSGLGPSPKIVDRMNFSVK